MFIRKTAALLVLVFFLFNTMGYYIAFEIMKSRARGEAHQKIRSSEKKELQTLIIPLGLSQDQFRWIHKHEFVYLGHMYDVKQYSESGNRMIIVCYKDDKENHLREGFRKMNEPDRKLLWSVYSKIIQVALPETLLTVVSGPVSEKKLTICCFMDKESAFISPPGHPPKHI